MRKVFKFSYFDYYLPLSEQCKQIKQLKGSEDISNYSLSALFIAKPEVFGPDVVNDRILMNLIESNGVKVTHNESLNIHKKGLGWKIEDGQGNSLRLGPLLRAGNVESFEGLWKIVSFNKEECFLEENSEWIIEQVEKLILDNKLDLHHMSLIYESLGENNGPYDILWEYYDRLMGNYIFNLLPEEFLRVVKGYSESKVMDKSESKWLRMTCLNLNFFKDFSNNQLIKYIISVDSLNIRANSYAINKLVKEAVNPNDMYQLYIMVKYKGFKLTKDILKEILKNTSVASKFELAEILGKLDIDDVSFELVLDSIISDQGPFEMKDVYGLSKIFLLKNSFYPQLFLLIQPFYPILDKLSMHEYKKLLEILCILKNADISFSEEFLDNVTNKFYEFKDQINCKNLQVFTHFFSYSMPVRAIHRLLCQKILENEKNDLIVGTRPKHEFYFKNGQGMFVVYCNELLMHLSLTTLLDVIICLQFRYQVKGDIKAVLKKYMKLILLRYDHKLAVKFRSKIAITLAIPENFDKELVNLLLENTNRAPKVKNAMLQAYPFMQAIKNLKHLDYIHPGFESLPYSSHTPYEPALDD